MSTTGGAYAQTAKQYLFYYYFCKNEVKDLKWFECAFYIHFNQLLLDLNHMFRFEASK